MGNKAPKQRAPINEKLQRLLAELEVIRCKIHHNHAIAMPRYAHYNNISLEKVCKGTVSNDQQRSSINHHINKLVKAMNKNDGASIAHHTKAAQYYAGTPESYYEYTENNDRYGNDREVPAYSGSLLWEKVKRVFTVIAIKIRDALGKENKHPLICNSEAPKFPHKHTTIVGSAKSIKENSSPPFTPDSSPGQPSDSEIDHDL